MTLVSPVERGRMESGRKGGAKGNWIVTVVTDIQFWVPFAVLLAGLVLLSVIR